MKGIELSLFKNGKRIGLVSFLLLINMTSAFYSFRLELHQNKMQKNTFKHSIDQNIKFNSQPKRNRIIYLNPRQSRRITSKHMLTNQMSYHNLDELTSGIYTASSEALQPIASSFWINTIETFDGSTIVDPVIVSNVFWVGLKTKILSILIGQFLAAIAFSFLASFISNNAVKMAEEVIAKKLSFLAKGSFDNFDNNSISTNPQQEQKQTQSIQKKRLESRGSNPSINIDVNKLILCLIIDSLGTSSEFIPILGELTDIGYAPIAALALRYLFTGSNIVFALEFVEEILPFTDILPLATICWIIETFYGTSDLARLLQIGSFGAGSVIPYEQEESDVYKKKQMNEDGVIDIPYKRNDDNMLKK